MIIMFQKMFTCKKMEQGQDQTLGVACVPLLPLICFDSYKLSSHTVDTSFMLLSNRPTSAFNTWLL